MVSLIHFLICLEFFLFLLPGLEGYTSILAQMNEADIRIPVVAIGGIVAEDIPAIMETGVNGIALSGAILQAPDPVEEKKEF